MKRIAVAAALMALAGCGGSGEKAASGEGANAAATGGTAGESASASASGGGDEMKLAAGEWEVTIESLGVEGMPEAAAAAMAGGGKTTATQCITEQESAQPESTLATGMPGANCTARDFAARNGRITGTMTCSGGEMGSMTLAMDGTFSSDRYEMTQKMTMGSGEEAMTTSTRISGRRIGNCPAGGEKEG